MRLALALPTWAQAAFVASIRRMRSEATWPKAQVRRSQKGCRKVALRDHRSASLARPPRCDRGEGPTADPGLDSREFWRGTGAHVRRNPVGHIGSTCRRPEHPGRKKAARNWPGDFVHPCGAPWEKRSPLRDVPSRKVPEPRRDRRSARSARRDGSSAPFVPGEHGKVEAARRNRLTALRQILTATSKNACGRQRHGTCWGPMSWNNDQNSCAVYSFRKHRKIADDRPVSTRYRSVSPGRTCRSTISGSGQQETFRRSSRFCHIEVGRGVLRTVAAR